MSQGPRVRLFRGQGSARTSAEWGRSGWCPGALAGGGVCTPGGTVWPGLLVEVGAGGGHPVGLRKAPLGPVFWHILSRWGGMGWDERTHSPWRLCTPPSQQAFHTHCHAELPFGPSHLSNPHHPLPPHPLAALADPGVDLGAQRPPLKPGIWNLDTRDIPWRTRSSGGEVGGGRGRLGEGPAFPRQYHYFWQQERSK